jgi:fructose-1,6-bisphosphatase II
VGGFIEGRLAPTTAAERVNRETAEQRFDTVLAANALVAGDTTMSIATGFTSSGLVEGVRPISNRIRTDSVVHRSRGGTFRRIVSEHLAARRL